MMNRQGAFIFSRYFGKIQNFFSVVAARGRCIPNRIRGLSERMVSDKARIFVWKGGRRTVYILIAVETERTFKRSKL